MVVFQTMLKLFLLLVLGFVLFKCHIFDEYTNKKISALIVNVASPMLIISSIAGVEGNDKSIVFLMIGAGILMYIGFIILGKIINRIFLKKIGLFMNVLLFLRIQDLWDILFY